MLSTKENKIFFQICSRSFLGLKALVDCPLKKDFIAASLSDEKKFRLDPLTLAAPKVKDLPYSSV